MNNGYCVLQWMRQNNYTLTSIADQIGYSRSKLSQALNHERMSARLVNALYAHYGLQVIATIGLAEQNQPIRGRLPGRVEERSSKLDQHMETIVRLLDEGHTQKDIASLYDTTPSNLSAWLKKRDIRRQRATV